MISLFFKFRMWFLILLLYCSLCTCISAINDEKSISKDNSIYSSFSLSPLTHLEDSLEEQKRIQFVAKLRSISKVKNKYSKIARELLGLMGEKKEIKDILSIKDSEGFLQTINVNSDSLKELSERVVLKELIATGWSAYIIKAEDQVTSTPLIIKIQRPENSKVGRFANEVRLLKQLEHLKVPKIYFSTDDYIAMEFIEGESFENLLKNETTSLLDILNHLSNAMVSLVDINDEGIIHGDINPSNIMISKEGVKIIDFGISLSAGERSNVIPGDAEHIAPERHKGDIVLPSTDVYSLGIILKIIERKVLLEELDYRLNSKVTKKDSVMDGLKILIQKSTNELPEKRYQNIRDFHSDLLQFLKSPEHFIHDNVKKNTIYSYNVRCKNSLNSIASFFREKFLGQQSIEMELFFNFPETDVFMTEKNEMILYDRDFIELGLIFKNLNGKKYRITLEEEAENGFVRPIYQVDLQSKQDNIKEFLEPKLLNFSFSVDNKKFIFGNKLRIILTEIDYLGSPIKTVFENKPFKIIHSLERNNVKRITAHSQNIKQSKILNIFGEVNVFENNGKYSLYEPINQGLYIPNVSDSKHARTGEVIVFNLNGSNETLSYKEYLGPIHKNVSEIISDIEKEKIIENANLSHKQSIMICVPTYNCENYIASTIEHLKKRLNEVHKKYPNWKLEIVIGINGVKEQQQNALDTVCEIQKKWNDPYLKLTLLYVPYQGKVHSMNALGEYAKNLKSTIICFADDDIVHSEGAFTKAFENLIQSGDLSYVGGVVEADEPQNFWEHLVRNSWSKYQIKVPTGRLMVMYTKTYPMIPTYVIPDDVYMFYYFMDLNAENPISKIIVDSDITHKSGYTSTFVSHIKRATRFGYGDAQLKYISLDKMIYFNNRLGNRVFNMENLKGFFGKDKWNHFKIFSSKFVYFGSMFFVRKYIFVELFIRKLLRSPKQTVNWQTDANTKLSLTREKSENNSMEESSFISNSNIDFQYQMEQMWKNEKVIALKKTFNDDLESLALNGHAGILFAASDSDGLTATTLLIKKIQNIAAKVNRKVKLYYSFDEDLNFEEDSVNLFVIGHQGDYFFSDNFYRSNLKAISAKFGKIPFFMLDLAWNSIEDIQFISKKFNFWYIDHHPFNPGLNFLINTFNGDVPSPEFNIKAFNSHYFIKKPEIADNYVVAGIVSDLLDARKGIELALASAPENYQNFNEVQTLYEDERIIALTNLINHLDLRIIHKETKSLINRFIISSLLESSSLESLYEMMTSNIEINNILSQIDIEVNQHINNITNILNFKADHKIIFYGIYKDSSNIFGIVSPIFKQLRELLEKDDRFKDKVIVLYEHLPDNRTYFRAGIGKKLIGKVDLSIIFSGNGVLNSEKIGGGHNNRVGGDSYSNLNVSVEQQIERMLSLKDKYFPIEVSRIGFWITLEYIKESIMKQLGMLYNETSYLNTTTQAYEYEGLTIYLEYTDDRVIKWYRILNEDNEEILSSDYNESEWNRISIQNQQLIKNALSVFLIVPDYGAVEILLQLSNNGNNSIIKKIAKDLLNERVKALNFDRAFDFIKEHVIMRQSTGFSARDDNGRREYWIFFNNDSGQIRVVIQYNPDEKTINKIWIEYPDTEWSVKQVVFWDKESQSFYGVENPIVGFYVQELLNMRPQITFIIRDSFLNHYQELFSNKLFGMTAELKWRVLPLSEALIKDEIAKDSVYHHCKQLPYDLENESYFKNWDLKTRINNSGIQKLISSNVKKLIEVLEREDLGIEKLLSNLYGIYEKYQLDEDEKRIIGKLIVSKFDIKRKQDYSIVNVIAGLKVILSKA